MNLWQRQLMAIIRIDLARTFFSKRGIWIYILALCPAIPMLGHWVFGSGNNSHGLGEDAQIFAGIFQFFYLRIAIFFGCVGIFMNLIRGEMLDKSLHFYLLGPVRREVLVAGKFLSGLIAAITIFCGSVVIQWVSIFVHHSPDLLSSYMFSGPGTSHLISYLLAAALACIGYGAVFLWAGVRYRNPLIPAAGILVWESANGILPALLKKLSIIYWLKSICPISIPAPKGVNGDDSIMALLVFDIEPAPAIVAILNLLLLAAFVTVWAGIRARRLEIGYGTE
jgi:ABC-type transport system involved in multi-copper enzyme maturation permease subunit